MDKQTNQMDAQTTRGLQLIMDLAATDLDELNWLQTDTEQRADMLAGLAWLRSSLEAAQAGDAE